MSLLIFDLVVLDQPRVYCYWEYSNDISNCYYGNCPSPFSYVWFCFMYFETLLWYYIFSGIAIPILLWWQFSWYILSNLLLLMYLCLWTSRVSLRHSLILGLIQCDNIWLFVRLLNPVTFNIIIDMVEVASDVCLFVFCKCLTCDRSFFILLFWYSLCFKFPMINLCIEVCAYPVLVVCWASWWVH